MFNLWIWHFGQRYTTCTCLCMTQASGQKWPLIIFSGYKSLVRKNTSVVPSFESFDILVCGSGCGGIRIHLICSTVDPGRKLSYNFDKNLSKFTKNILNNYLFCKRQFSSTREQYLLFYQFKVAENETEFKDDSTFYCKTKHLSLGSRIPNVLLEMLDPDP